MGFACAGAEVRLAGGGIGVFGSRLPLTTPQIPPVPCCDGFLESLGSFECRLGGLGGGESEAFSGVANCCRCVLSRPSLGCVLTGTGGAGHLLVSGDTEPSSVPPGTASSPRCNHTGHALAKVPGPEPNPRPWKRRPSPPTSNPSRNSARGSGIGPFRFLESASWALWRPER